MPYLSYQEHFSENLNKTLREFMRIYVESMTLNSQCNLEQKEQSGKQYATWL